MLVWVFIVEPDGPTFATTVLEQGGDTSRAYFKAHRAAAEIAARERKETHVLRDDTGDLRYGFGPRAYTEGKGILHDIRALGLASVWDFVSNSWIPVSSETSAQCASDVEKTVSTPTIDS